MENSSEFISYCLRAGIHLVLFGHDHHEFSHTCSVSAELTNGSNHKMTFFCCPSASEYASQYGFCTFKFDTHGYDFSFYKWNDRIKEFEAGGLDQDNRFVRNKLLGKDEARRIGYIRTEGSHNLAGLHGIRSQS